MILFVLSIVIKGSTKESEHLGTNSFKISIASYLNFGSCSLIFFIFEMKNVFAYSAISLGLVINFHSFKICFGG